MTERKVIPITGRHTTFSSMMAECMADDTAARGIVVYFNEEGTMKFGHIGTTFADICMAAIYINGLADEAMRQPDEN